MSTGRKTILGLVYMYTNIFVKEYLPLRFGLSSTHKFQVTKREIFENAFSGAPTGSACLSVWSRFLRSCVDADIM